MSQPLVLGLHPVRGWQAADRPRRAFALLCPGLILAWTLAQLTAPEAGGTLVVLTALTVGCPAFYSAARVLRPHQGRCAEREFRHALASGSTAFGTATVLALLLGGGPALLLALPSSLGLVLTLPWGIVALLVRAASAPVGQPVGQPRTWPSPVTT
ncbi:MAG: hypothetical protein WCD35_01635 [Mycobacteriales bacterium]